jgi:hypothetical protein
MVDRKATGPITIERQWFIDSRQGNIKDDYYFEKKLGSGGYGAVYLAKHKKTGKDSGVFLITHIFYSVIS